MYWTTRRLCQLLLRQGRATNCRGQANGSSASAESTLFKRLESSGAAFLQSVERHVLRNYVFLHAIRNGLPLPLGTQDAEMLDSRFTDEDADQAKGALFDPDDDEQEESLEETGRAWTAADFEARAAQISLNTRAATGAASKWLRSDLFKSSLRASFCQTPTPSKVF